MRFTNGSGHDVGRRHRRDGGKFRRAAAVVLMAAGVGSGAGCDRKAAPAAAAPQPTEVSFVTIRPETTPASFEFIGQTEASQAVEIRARVQGFLQDWRKNFTEGGMVREGQLLFNIDPREFQVAFEEAQANAARAEARQQRADREVVRLQEAVATKAASGRELDDAVTEQLQARADVRLQRSTLDARQLNLNYTTVKSPLDGVVGRSQRDVGSLVDATQNSLLTTVSKLDPLYAYFSFSERDYVNFRQDVQAGRVQLSPGGQTYVEVSLIDGTPYPFAGEVNFADVAVDAQTGSVRLRAAFHNPQVQTTRGTEHFLKPGQYVKGRLVGYVRPNTITVPQMAVQQATGGATVYTVGADNKAEVRPVTTGGWVGDDWVITAGLRSGDRVIVDGVAKVTPNAVVTAKERAPSTRPAMTTRPTSGPATGPMTMPAAGGLPPVSGMPIIGGGSGNAPAAG
ncbi:MAG: efflux pump, rane fusion protein CzcB subfamily, partial [Phycisphaerales bacterium]|nr:efflux pump, rane fusion protein CzcB subfamily [Phycisphaerales bacterium]